MKWSTPSSVSQKTASGDVVWALRHPEEAAHVPITTGWMEARAVLVLWAAAGAIAAAHVLPTEVMALVGIAVVHGGLLTAALVWGGVGLGKASLVIAMLAGARALVGVHALGALAYLAVPLWLGRLALRGRLTRLGLAPPWPWGAVFVGALAGTALALHLVTSVSRTLGYGIRFDLAALLLACALPCERLFCTAPVARLQIERVLLDILDDIFLLNLPFEAAESAFDRLALLDLHFSHARTPPLWAADELVVK